MVQSVVISSAMNLSQAVAEINKLSQHDKLHFKVKKDANNIQYLHVRSKGLTDKIREKLNRRDLASQKKASLNVIQDITVKTYPNLKKISIFDSDTDKLSVFKLMQAIKLDISMNNVVEGIRQKKPLLERIDDQVYQLKTRINPSKLGKGLD